MLETLRAVKFLFMGPVILLFLALINVMTSPGHWWVQWAALGIGIAWVISLIKVVRAVIIAGGLAALGAYLLSRSKNP
ncbi:MAG: 2TM domain-containing protein [Vicinamibacterales bacterium]